MDPQVRVRAEHGEDAAQVAEVTRAAFGADGDRVALLPAALSGHHLHRQGFSLVADSGGAGIVGHVQLSRCWVDDDRRLVRGLTLSPLSVLPAHQRRGIGTALVSAAVRAADDAGEPFVMLEGDPALYGRWGFTPAADHGLTPPSRRVPSPACQVLVLRSWDPHVAGALVYNDVFWDQDVVGLRGDTLQRVRAALTS